MLEEEDVTVLLVVEPLFVLMELDDEDSTVLPVVEPLFVEETVVEGAESVVDVCTVVDEFDDRSALLPVFPRTLLADGTLTSACDPVRDFVAPLE